MTRNKNDLFVVRIEDISDKGEGIGKTDGYTWFIKDAIIGDTVEAKVLKVKKTFGFARLEKIVTPSDKRVKPLCPVARQCGGCQLQSLDYGEQLKFKERKVVNNLIRIGKFEREDLNVLPMIGMDYPWRYRNKAQFPFGTNKNGEVITGFYASRTHSIVEHSDCYLGAEVNKKILEKIKEFMNQYHIQPYDEENHKGLVRHVLIRIGFKTEEIMVCLVINGRELPFKEKFIETLLEVPRMRSISYNINEEKTNVILGREVISLYGPGYISDFIGDIKYQISPLSFFQVNPIQTEKLYQTVLDFAGLTGTETVWDVYCGIGTISLYLANKAKQIYSVELVPEAIEDARRNAQINMIENVEFFVGKAEDVLPEQFRKGYIYADVVVVDPPRKGCDSICLDTIVEIEPERIIYVSCDSATLARDLRYLCDRGYQIEKLRCCDMFGQSVHVETVVGLHRRDT